MASTLIDLPIAAEAPQPIRPNATLPVPTVAPAPIAPPATHYGETTVIAGGITVTPQDYVHRDIVANEVQDETERSGDQNSIRLVRLGRLASQHHLSPYSVMKYGVNG